MGRESRSNDENENLLPQKCGNSNASTPGRGVMGKGLASAEQPQIQVPLSLHFMTRSKTPQRSASLFPHCEVRLMGLTPRS